MRARADFLSRRSVSEGGSAERARANAAAQVVLPTPPLPPKKTRRGSASEGKGSRLGFLLRLEALDVNARDPVLGGHGDRALLRTLDLSDGGEDIALGFGELVVGDFAELQAHLGFVELFAERGAVLHLGFGRLYDLFEHEAKTA